MRRATSPARARQALTAAVIACAGTFLFISLLPASALANGVPFAKGDVLADVGHGLIRHYNSTGTLLDTLETTVETNEGDGMCFDAAGNLYATEGFVANTMSKFDTNGNLVAKEFGSGFNEHPESCVFDSSDHMYVGQPDGEKHVLEFDTSGTPLGSFAPEAEDRGTDWIDLAADGCTLHYTSEGNAIKEFDICTNKQLTPFATELPDSPCYAHRILPSGEELVACTTKVLRVNTEGKVVQEYEPEENGFLFALNLDPDHETFWTAGYGSGKIYRINIATGAIVTSFTAPPESVLGGIAVVGEITAPPKITLAPSSAENPVGTTHTVVATVTEGGTPVEGTTVTFTVTGANPLTGTATTNSSGEASFTYKGENAGEDHIVATFKDKSGKTDESNVATKLWTAPRCTRVSGTGHWGPRGPEGGNLDNNLSTTLSEREELQTTGPGGGFHMHLTHLASASCVAVPGGFEFSGTGSAKVNHENGYTIAFSFEVAGGHTFYTLIAEKEGVVVFALLGQQLRRDGTEHIS